MTTDYRAPAQTHIGHIHLKVSNLDTSVEFYRDVMGFDVVFRYGDQAAFLSAGGYHHHIGLNTWESDKGSPPAPGATGLYHLAINYPTRRDLAAALHRLIEKKWPIGGASDHGTHEALYLSDPDGIGIELAWDRDQNLWTAADGSIVMKTARLDLDDLLSELEAVDQIVIPTTT